MLSNSYKTYKEYVLARLVDETLDKYDYLTLNWSGASAIDHPYNKAEDIFNSLYNQAVKCIRSNRLDRHKIASCMCGAIIQAKPLTYHYNCKKPDTGLNEILAIQAGLDILKMFMLDDYKMADARHQEIYKSFPMRFPDIVVCDKNSYGNNLVSALSRTGKCYKRNEPCTKFDIWAYAKIFYHIELHNAPLLEQYIQSH